VRVPSGGLGTPLERWLRHVQDAGRIEDLARALAAGRLADGRPFVPRGACGRPGLRLLAALLSSAAPALLGRAMLHALQEGLIAGRDAGEALENLVPDERAGWLALVAPDLPPAPAGWNPLEPLRRLGPTIDEMKDGFGPRPGPDDALGMRPDLLLPLDRVLPLAPHLPHATVAADLRQAFRALHPLLLAAGARLYVALPPGRAGVVAPLLSTGPLPPTAALALDGADPQTPLVAHAPLPLLLEERPGHAALFAASAAAATGSATLLPCTAHGAATTAAAHAARGCRPARPYGLGQRRIGGLVGWAPWQGRGHLLCLAGPPERVRTRLAEIVRAHAA
jgi:hypothetical protein